MVVKLQTGKKIADAEQRTRWEATVVHNTNLSDLRALIKEGGLYNPCIVGLRSICWKVSDL